MVNSRVTYKKEAYEQAIAFRKRGFTYTEIAKICDVSRGTVSNWLKDEGFSKRIAKTNLDRAYKDNVGRIKLVNKARNAERTAQYKEILRLAETEYKHYLNSPLFVSGLMLYRCEGDMKHKNLIRLTTGQTELHSIFIKFATEFLGVEKSSFRFWLLLYPDMDEVKAMKHWSRKIKLSVSQFYKNQFINGGSKKALHFGVGNTIIGSTLLKKKLMHWLELASKDLQK
ncbi:MAG: helix-turn-helix domain-containing protein [Candidatus Nomurabacteria bacterium]|nr:helix-turn-helix domain-containing protein [Candidatus Nomurabacteria bacterium]USN87423.1 MAG: helix-turn-helix domain-containing protein [Candidatus Nomurabacteria bacterium]